MNEEKKYRVHLLMKVEGPDSKTYRVKRNLRTSEVGVLKDDFEEVFESFGIEVEEVVSRFINLVDEQ